MSWLKENWFKIGLLGVVLILTLSLAYYYVVLLPQKERAIMDQQKQEQMKVEIDREMSKELLEDCLGLTELKAQNEKQEYMQNIVGTQTPTETIAWSLEQIDKRLFSEKEECYQKYAQ